MEFLNSIVYIFQGSRGLLEKYFFGHAIQLSLERTMTLQKKNTF